MITTILATLILSAAFSTIAYCFYILYRNNKVFKFRRWVCDTLIFIDYEYAKRLEIYNKVPYEKMLHSHKPLCLRSFFTEDEIMVLQSGVPNKEQSVQVSDTTEE